jgi:hypothetical protein
MSTWEKLPTDLQKGALLYIRTKVRKQLVPGDKKGDEVTVKPNEILLKHQDEMKAFLDEENKDEGRPETDVLELRSDVSRPNPRSREEVQINPGDDVLELPVSRDSGAVENVHSQEHDGNDDVGRQLQDETGQTSAEVSRIPPSDKSQGNNGLLDDPELQQDEEEEEEEEEGEEEEEEGDEEEDEENEEEDDGRRYTIDDTRLENDDTRLMEDVDEEEDSGEDQEPSLPKRRRVVYE